MQAGQRVGGGPGAPTPPAPPPAGEEARPAPGSASSPIQGAREQPVSARTRRQEPATSSAVSKFMWKLTHTSSGRKGGKWESWGAWGGCNQTCGSGQRLRRRECGFEDSSCKGTSCIGPQEQADTCNTQCCKWQCCAGVCKNCVVRPPGWSMGELGSVGGLQQVMWNRLHVQSKKVPLPRQLLQGRPMHWRRKPNQNMQHSVL